MGSMVNSNQKHEFWDAGIVNKSVEKGMCGATGDDQCYPVNKNILGVLGRVDIQKLDSHFDAAVEVEHHPHFG